MRCMVIVKATADSEAGVMPTEAELSAMGEFNQKLGDAGVMVDGDGLQPSRKGVRVRLTREPEVTGGPFAPVEDLVAGYWIWEVESMDEAVKWAKQIPFEREGDTTGQVEIRPLVTPEDFGEELTPELRNQEERLRRQIAGS